MNTDIQEALGGDAFSVSTSTVEAFATEESQLSLSTRAYRASVCVIGCVGVLGNGVVFVVMVSNKKLRRLLTSTLIANQALVDMMCGLTLVLTYGYKSAPVTRFNGQGREILCFLLQNELLLFGALNASTYCLMVITLERYLMIVRPIFHRTSFSKQWAIGLAATAWLAGFLWNGIPTGVTTRVRGSGKCSLYNYRSYEEQEVFGYVYVAATFFVPMVLFGVAYGHMMAVLGRRVRQVNQKDSKDNNMSRAQVNLTKTMVLVTLAFAICWTPNQIMYMLFNAGVLSPWGGPVYIATLFMAFLNCCINPFIYALKYESFRAVISKPICKKKPIAKILLRPQFFHCVWGKRNFLELGFLRTLIQLHNDRLTFTAFRLTAHAHPDAYLHPTPATPVRDDVTAGEPSILPKEPGQQRLANSYAGRVINRSEVEQLNRPRVDYSYCVEWTYSGQYRYHDVMDRFYSYFFNGDPRAGGADSFSDRLSCNYTVVTILIAVALVTTRVYVGEPVSCWCPAFFTDSHIDYTNK
ncbi:hypothetical protein CAPTEDRAFT_199860, partial [Capitella teleta]